MQCVNADFGGDAETEGRTPKAGTAANVGRLFAVPVEAAGVFVDGVDDVAGRPELTAVGVAEQNEIGVIFKTCVDGCGLVDEHDFEDVVGDVSECLGGA